MKTIILLLVVFMNGVLHSQSGFITQITDYSYNSIKPAVPEGLSGIFTVSDPGFVFEIQEGSSTNIGFIKYFPANDSFDVPVRITDNNFLNINPSLSIDIETGSLLTIFQTNENGNWDIAVSKNEGGIWTAPGLLTNSNEDEINPSFLTNTWESDTLWILYEKAQSVHLISYEDGVTADRIIFQAYDTISYSGAAGLYPWHNFEPLNLVAIEHSPSQQKVVFRTLDIVTGILSGIEIINDNGISDSPDFFIFTKIGPVLTYSEKPGTGYRNFFYMNNWVNNKIPLPLLDNPPPGDLSCLSISPVYFLARLSDVTSEPYTYMVSRNDSTFIRLNLEPDQIISTDTIMYTRVSNAHPVTGLMSLIFRGNYIYYTLFEDSANGHINLFGRKQVLELSGITNQGQSDLDFELSQNYPNPFNPSTTINYQLPQTSFVTLKIYDILGKEVATLVNEQQNQGRYSVNFSAIGGSAFGGDAAGLSSGIYFYKLQAGSFSATRKMILMK